MILRVYAVAAALLLSGCQTKPLTALNYTEQQQMIKTILDRCHSQGVKPGTQQEKDCFAQEVRAEQYQRDQNVVAKARAHEAFSQMARNQAMVDAARASQQVNCTSTYFGNQTRTNCY